MIQITQVTDRLTNIELTLYFTYELGNNNTLPFLYILLIDNYK